MDRKKILSIVLGAAAVVFLLQPMVVYVAAYDPSDCDDKAVHYFSAMYAAASRAERDAFRDGIAPFVSNAERNPRWFRTAFRLHSTNAYPLANLIIASVHAPGDRFAESVKWSLFLVTLIAIVVVALVASATPFGFWPAVVTLNLIAWRVAPMKPVLEVFQANMLPFLAYVPRGAGSLLVIPAVLGFAARRWWLFAATLLGVFAWHLGLGAITAAVVPAGVVLASLVLRRTADFHERALIAGAMVLAVAMMVSALTDLGPVDGFVRSVSGVPMPRQVSQRLMGCEYSLYALVVVLAARLVVERLARWSAIERWWESPSVSRIAMVVLLGAIGVWRASIFQNVAYGRSGFFTANCDRTVSIALPGNWRKLSLDREESMFVSFGDYLLALREEER